MERYTLKLIPFDVVYAFILANIAFYLLGIAEASDIRQINFGMIVIIMAFVAVGTIATKLVPQRLFPLASPIFAAPWAAIGQALQPCSLA